MTDHKFTDDEIVKALECCVNGKSIVEVCSRCPFFLDGNCTDLLKQNALALINRQKVEIESLKIANEKMYSANKEQEAEIESLNAVHADMTESLRLAAEANKDMSAELKAMRGAAHAYKMHYENAKAEAIKEFAERLYDNVKLIPDAYLSIEYEINALAKEMTEDLK